MVVVLVRVADPEVCTVVVAASQTLYPPVNDPGRLAGPFAAVPVLVGAAAGPVAHGSPAHSGKLTVWPR
ncbi:MAG TPA: hypothetical protein VFJ97_07655 [Dermatophilaceae bacterium]|nr:hypothetical protein [Dermatophilaceae bacterium]